MTPGPSPASSGTRARTSANHIHASRALLSLPAGPRLLGMVVTDLDRTLTDLALRPVPAALRQLERLRSLGVVTVLATGRRRAELDGHPELLGHFDHLVLEGGAVTGQVGRLEAGPGGQRVRELRAWLRRSRIPHEAGQACLSVEATFEAMLAARAQAAGLRLQRNGDRVDITAAEVTKGSGLRKVREQAHAPGLALAFADGENDVPLARAADHLVAVANAHARLATQAHERTALPGGAGVADFLERRVAEAAD